MSNKSVLKRQRQNIKKRKYNKYKKKTIKILIKNIKKDLIEKKIDNIKILKNLSFVFSKLDKLRIKKIIHINKVSRIKSQLSNLVNKYKAH
ncbi:MAG: 30S ribosomal protein S20 [Candidatus Shikimatogenerans bostrichidophilus]|nr:MAG: 30S ribosomal protein S20 [Candidatus Shikimatogenerans bostrichidophilus]